jgi:hypothetical protein
LRKTSVPGRGPTHDVRRRNAPEPARLSRQPSSSRRRRSLLHSRVLCRPGSPAIRAAPPGGRRASGSLSPGVVSEANRGRARCRRPPSPEARPRQSSARPGSRRSFRFVLLAVPSSPRQRSAPDRAEAQDHRRDPAALTRGRKASASAGGPQALTSPRASTRTRSPRASPEAPGRSRAHRGGLGAAEDLREFSSGFALPRRSSDRPRLARLRRRAAHLADRPGDGGRSARRPVPRRARPRVSALLERLEADTCEIAEGSERLGRRETGRPVHARVLRHRASRTRRTPTSSRSEAFRSVRAPVVRGPAPLPRRRRLLDSARRSTRRFADRHRDRIEGLLLETIGDAAQRATFRVLPRAGRGRHGQLRTSCSGRSTAGGPREAGGHCIGLGTHTLEEERSVAFRRQFGDGLQTCPVDLDDPFGSSVCQQTERRRRPALLLAGGRFVKGQPAAAAWDRC